MKLSDAQSVSSADTSESGNSLSGSLLEYAKNRIGQLVQRPQNNHLIVIEGLDGVGKTIATRTLADRINGLAYSSPINKISRETRRDIDRVAFEEPNRRFDFYHAANVTDSKEYLQPALASGNTVVLDRYALSTLIGNMALGATLSQHPLICSVSTTEPDIVLPSATVLLTLEESVREQRLSERIKRKGLKPDNLIDIDIALQHRADSLYHQLIPHGLLEVSIDGLTVEDTVQKIIDTLNSNNISLT